MAATHITGSDASGAGAGIGCDGESEMLALVCTDSPALCGPAKLGPGAEGMSEQEQINALNARRESLKLVMSRTQTNLAYFTEQCKSNPSCEVREDAFNFVVFWAADVFTRVPGTTTAARTRRQQSVGQMAGSSLPLPCSTRLTSRMLAPIHRSRALHGSTKTGLCRCR
jgi:hypothetical protein